MRWVMVIDIKKCIGCQGCTISCKAANCLPSGISWNTLHDEEVGTYPNVSRYFVPSPCMHCKDPACEEVCPTGATIQREDGIVWVDYDKCMGCKYCIVACPYQARHINLEEKYYFPGQPTPPEEMSEELFPQKPRVGVTSKCNFCKDIIDEGLKKGLKPGVDREATPVCVDICVAKARYFGDLDDPYSEVSRLIKERHGFQLHPELGTDPSVYYLL
ncbi:MAG: 4Fe-4S dicluster domain-containing protein [Deltaproteobacteria bacterium]|nr:4Fe-4S dicluster domain-containing protein [Deltaproteobacteria bacterium]